MYIRPSKDNDERIKEEGRIERERKKRGNDALKHERRRAMSDEQTAINKHSEGFCYQCARTDHIISSLFYVCLDCIEARGREGIINFVYRKPSEELCDICNRWKQNIWQINTSFCLKCMDRVHRIHKAYRRSGKRKNHPFWKKMKKKHGKDMNELFGSGIMKFLR